MRGETGGETNNAKMNTTVMILIAVIALTQVFGFVIIRTLSKRVRNIDLSEKNSIVMYNENFLNYLFYYELK